MPLPEPTFTPPFNIVRCSHAVLAVTDLARSRAFYEGAIGLRTQDEDASALWLRGVEERNHHSLVLKQADAPECLRLGFKVASEEDLERAHSFFARQGLPCRWSEEAFQGR